MSLYVSNEGARQGSYDESIGLDIDGDIVSSTPGGDNYYDYDLLNRPSVSGSGIIIPPMNDGFPKRSDYTNARDQNKQFFNADGTLKDRSDGMADAFRLKAFVNDDQSATLDTMTETTNNGIIGDVNIVKDVSLPMESEIVIKKDNQDTSIKGILEQNSINDIFFSDMNMKGLQQTIRYKVFQNTNQVVSDQSSNDLYIIMRSIMLQFANFRTDVENIAEEIRRLNGKVIEYAVENVSSNVQQHAGYIDKLSKLPVPLDAPAYLNKKNFTYDISNLL
jgi:hypothetical protein